MERVGWSGGNDISSCPSWKEFDDISRCRSWNGFRDLARMILAAGDHGKNEMTR